VSESCQNLTSRSLDHCPGHPRARPFRGSAADQGETFRFGNVPGHSFASVSFRYTERLVEAGIESSVGSVGDSYDNALAETVNGLYKTEVIHPHSPWRNAEQVEFATLEWVDWFNNRRLLQPVGDIPPAEFEAKYYEEQNAQAKAA
jgi:transposase InsO family protein